MIQPPIAADTVTDAASRAIVYSSLPTAAPGDNNAIIRLLKVTESCTSVYGYGSGLPYDNTTP